MSILVQATAPAAPKTERAKQISLLYAIILVIVLVTQLFTFDEFLELFVNYGMPGAGVLVPAVIACELFALPFLLRMKVSPAFRWLSMLCGWAVAGIWTFVSVWILTSLPGAETVGFIGTLAPLVPGWWAVFVALSFGVLAAWASWGMWPEPISVQFAGRARRPKLVTKNTKKA